MASTVACLTGLGLFFALVLRPRRREPVAETIGQAPSSPAPNHPNPGSDGEAPFAQSRGMSQTIVSPDTPPEEIGIPRWRRPSLRAARQLSERDIPVEHLPLLFPAPPRADEDRRSVVYRLVRIGTQPDEFAGDEVGRLDRGDEVEVLAEEAGYCFVRTPLDTIGWVHRTTLRRPDDGPAYELRLQTDA
jgi:hypothetical protein